MAGVKGRSGGARPGAGRKKKAAVEIAPEVAKATPGEPLDPRPTLELIALGHMEVSPAQMKALVALLPYVHAKQGTAASKPKTPELPVGKPKFGVRQGPRLVSSR